VDDDKLLLEVTAQFPQSQIIARPGPQEAFAAIARSRFVITGRYHGMIFARVCRVPFITPVDSPYKIRMEDLNTDISAATGHFEVLQRFLPR
jgi:exopolysaccharide biosynthesis predicted pyruvyltransferase EpsI